MTNNYQEVIGIDRDIDKVIRTATQSHIEVKNIYTPSDIMDLDYDRDLGNPGEFPYTRGIYPGMYRDRLWLKSFIISYATPEETNIETKKYIEQGLTDIRVDADQPIQCGIDPDHPMSFNSMMCGGVSTYAINVYEKMLDGISLEDVVYEYPHQGMSNSMYFYSLIVAMMENRGLDIKNFRGSNINDPFRARLIYDTPDFPNNINHRVCLDHIEFAARNTPKFKGIAPNGVDPCQAGMNAVQELAHTIGGAIAVMKDLEKRGINLDEYGSMVVALDAESDFFETIAKFRLARKLWAEAARDIFKAKTKKAMKLKIGTRTSGFSLMTQMPLWNASRVTLQMLSAILGGVNSMDPSSIDEAVGLPGYEARMFNIATQQIITHEANIPIVADPLAGSYYLEWLMKEMERQVKEYLAEVEEQGGMWEALDSGWIANQMEKNRLKIQRERTERKRIFVGVNAFHGIEGPINRAVRSNAYQVPSVEDREAWIKECLDYKAGRNFTVLKSKIRQLYFDTQNGENINRACIEAAKSGATIGEFTGTVRLAYGIEYDPFKIIDAPSFIKEAIK